MKGQMWLFSSYHNRKDIGSSRIRGEWVMKYWPECTPFNPATKADFVIYQKVFYLEHAKHYPGIKILDLCDPDWLEFQPVMEMISLCDAVTVSSPKLKEFLEKWTQKPVVHIPDRVDFEENVSPKTTHKERIEWAVWYGYSHNKQVVQHIKPALERRGIKLKVVSDKLIKECDQWVQYDRETINNEIKSADIAVLPQPNDLRGQFKSNNKIINAWSLGMPVALYGDYDATREHAEQCIEKLESKEAREQESKNKLELVKKEYNCKLSVKQYEELIWSLKK